MDKAGFSEFPKDFPGFLELCKALKKNNTPAGFALGHASGDATLLSDAFYDTLHEPYRAVDAPLLGQLRTHPVVGCAGVTLSGSGPSVVVWVEKDKIAPAAAELEARLPDARVLPLKIADHGAEAQ